MEQPESIKCLIIGSGPAGLTAAIYAARANIGPVVYEGTLPGGQLTTTNDVENFPGYPDGVNGMEMMTDMRRQAERFGAQIRFGVVSGVDFSSRPFRVTVDESHHIEAQSVIIATGASARWLGLESERHFRGSGVSACATCDGFFYRGQDVAVVGGGDVACEDATYLATICRKVYMVVRKPYFAASHAMQKKVLSTPNIEVLFEHVVAEVTGDDSGVNGLIVSDNKKGEKLKINVTGLFVAIGHVPNTQHFQGQIDLDQAGYIRTRPDSMCTSVEGVFAAGDVRDPHFRQGIIAAGSGAMAALECERWLKLQ